MINDDITLRYTACHNYFLVILQTLVDLVLEVLLGRVLDGAGVEEPDAGLVLVLGDGVALGRQLARHVLAVTAVVGTAPGPDVYLGLARDVVTALPPSHCGISGVLTGGAVTVTDTAAGLEITLDTSQVSGQVSFD